MDPIECYDVTIIGGGPAGLFASFYSGLRNLKTKIIEYQPHLGGKIHVYPEKMIWDVGGLKPLSGAQLIEQLTEQGLTFNPTVVLNEKIAKISKREDGVFVLMNSNEEVHYSKTVIVATGSGILNPQKLEIEGAERFEISNLHYTIPSYKQFQDKVVLVSGGRDAAIDIALELEEIAKKVYLIYRKDQLVGHEAQVDKLLNSSVTCLFDTVISTLRSVDNHTISQVELQNNIDNTFKTIDVDEVVINHGFERDASIIQNSDISIELIDDFYIACDNKSASSVEGLYAAGDILYNDSKVHLILGTFQDATNAVNSAKKYLEPDAEATAMVSSHNDVFKERNQALVHSMLKKAEC